MEKEDQEGSRLKSRLPIEWCGWLLKIRKFSKFN